MSWVDKAHKKNKIYKLVEQALKDPRFKEAQKKQSEEDVLKAFRAFMTISADYLYRHDGYHKKRLTRYIDFVAEQMGYVAKDEEYFKLLNEELKKETGIDITGKLLQ